MSSKNNGDVGNKSEINEFMALQNEFIASYSKHKDDMEIEDWLQMEMEQRLPDTPSDEIKETIKEIIDTLNTGEENRKSLKKSLERGIDKNHWFASEIKKHTANMSKEEEMEYVREIDETILAAMNSNIEDLGHVIENEGSVESDKSNAQKMDNKNRLNISTQTNEHKNKQGTDIINNAIYFQSSKGVTNYLNNLDNTLKEVNNNYIKTIHNKNGTINMNRNLDGFIVENHHETQFNLKAASMGSKYKAGTLNSNGKNSVDNVIKDGTNKIVRKYQSKACKDIPSTKRAFKHGDYNFQRKLVTKGQETGIKNSATVMEAPDGTKSTPISKAEAKKIQEEVQKGKYELSNWNDYSMKDISINIAKNAGISALAGAGIGATCNVISKIFEGDDIEPDEVIVDAISTGATLGLKTATAGALKVGVEKGLANGLASSVGKTALEPLRNTSVLTGIASVAIDNISVVSDFANGSITGNEAMDRIEENAIVTVSSFIGMDKVGAAIGGVLGGGPVGAFVGSVIGGAVGSKVGKGIVKATKAVRNVARSVVNGVCSAVSSVASGISSVVSSVASSIGSFFGF